MNIHCYINLSRPCYNYYVWQEGTGEKDFPVLRDSRSRYVQRNDNNDDIP